MKDANITKIETDITDDIADLRHELISLEDDEILRERHRKFQRRKLNAIPEWLQCIFMKTIWRNIKIN